MVVSLLPPSPLLDRQLTHRTVCGAGGATRGAKMAGFRINYGFDNDEHSAANWRSNFPTATMYEVDAHDLVRWPNAQALLKVDILHLSPPCQFFSPAHTIAGVNDEKNFAIIFSCGMILDAAKPRMGTLEQTFGIMHAAFQPVFKALICMFTSRGYSVRWTIAPLQEWGLPQRRQRLVIFFAGPGEPLPEFPAFTHSDQPRSHLKPLASCEQMLRSIPRNHPLHNIAMAIPRDMHPWDGGSIAPKCITTSGGQNYHFSGSRDFTLAEFLVLQGFPLYHIFRGSYIKKQIGNAVPPMIAVLWFKSLRKALEKADGIASEEEIIDIEDNAEDDIVIVDDPPQPQENHGNGKGREIISVEDHGTIAASDMLLSQRDAKGKSSDVISIEDDETLVSDVFPISVRNDVKSKDRQVISLVEEHETLDEKLGGVVELD